MANVFDFSSETVNVFMMVVDRSGSMEENKKDVCEGLESYKKEFRDFYAADSIAVAISTFNEDYYEGEFKKVKDLDIKYNNPVGVTALYYSIEKGAEQLLDYIEQVINKIGTVPKGTFILFSDGEPCEDPGNFYDAKEAIERLNNAGITTAFVAFGKAITSEFGKKLGFQSTVDVVDREKISKFLGEELVNSSKSQSRSLGALGSKFFSQVDNGKGSSGYSNTTNQALEDDDWFDSI